MSVLPAVLRDLPLPVIAAPLFIISTPQLVIAQCIAGVVGSMPALTHLPAQAVRKRGAVHEQPQRVRKQLLRRHGCLLFFRLEHRRVCALHAPAPKE